ncbi:HesB/IscA family protein [Aquirufa sp. 5-AUSEE-100C1]
MITISEIAANRIKEIRQNEGLTEDFNVRVAVEGGGCSGLMYQLDFASEQQASDMIFEDKGVKVMVDKKSILYLAGTELDFSDGLNGKGFQFKNPNATRTCGCGESFSI